MDATTITIIVSAAAIITTMIGTTLACFFSLKSEIFSFRTEFKTDISGLKTELKNEISELKKEVSQIDKRLIRIESRIEVGGKIVYIKAESEDCKES